MVRNTSSPGNISFEYPVQFNTVPGSVFSSVGDIDQDGKPDLVVACNNDFGDGYVSVLRNTSDPGTIHPGSFEPAINLHAGYGGIWFAGVSDLDGDRRPEVIASNGGGATISIFRNVSVTGTITVESFDPKIELVTGAYPAIIAISDLDGDLKPDLAVGNAAGNSISLFKNISTYGVLGSGSFNRVADIPATGPWNTTAADVDGDGKPDLLVRRSSRGLLSVYKNKSSTGNLSEESFSAPYTILHEGVSLGISVADMDGDAKSDLIVSSENISLVTVMRNEDLYEAQPPSNLRFTNITGISLTATYLPSPDPHDGYIAIRRIGAFSDHPVDGTFYTIGQEIGEDVVAYVGSETSFDDASLLPGMPYFYRVYAYSLHGSSIEYTKKWDADVGFTIGPDLGPIVTTSPETFSMDDLVTFTFDATRSHPLNAVVGASTIIVRSGIVTDPANESEWHPNHIAYSYLTPVGDDKWQMTFVPRQFYNYVPRDMTVYKLGMTFSDGEGHQGLSFDGRPIYLEVSPTVVRAPTTLRATFVSHSGFVAEWEMVYDISEYFLDVSASETFDTFLPGYENTPVYGWGTIRSALSGLAPETTYYYRVRTAGAPENSGTISVTTTALPDGGAENVWVQTHGGPGNQEIQSMTTDYKGNVYAAGHFVGTVTFGSIVLHSQGDFDVFFVKYDRDGRVLWARSIGGPELDNEVSLTADSKSLYMSGQFQGVIDVDPGPGVKRFFNEGEWWVNDTFFARYSMDDGSLIWAHTIPDAYGLSSSSISADRSGVYLAGQFYGSSDFDPSEKQHILESQGDFDIFLAKYSHSGNLLWARSVGGYYTDAAMGVMADGSGIYIHGNYNWQCDFDPGPDYYYLDNYGGFFARYDQHNGNLIYAKNVGNGQVFSVGKHGRDIYLSGEIIGVVDADPDEGVHFVGREGFGGAIVGKYSMIDGSLKWAREIITTDFIGARKVIADHAGAYVSGYVAGSTDFQSGPDEEARTVLGIDAFVARYNGSGGLSWVKTLGSPGYAVSIAAAMTDDGYYLGGLYIESVNFDPYEGSVVRTSEDAQDIFIARYQLEKKGKPSGNNHDDEVVRREGPDALSLFPNPATSTLFVDLSTMNGDEPVHVTILDLAGNAVKTFTVTKEVRSLDLTGVPEGIMVIQVRQNNYLVTQRFVKK